MSKRNVDFSQECGDAEVEAEVPNSSTLAKSRGLFRGQPFGSALGCSSDVGRNKLPSLLKVENLEEGVDEG